jgi:phage-related protein
VPGPVRLLIYLNWDSLHALKACAGRATAFLAAKRWKAEGPGVIDVVQNFDGDTFRAVYTVKFRKAIYVLHCFQKKSPSGIRMAKTDVNLVKERLKAARRDYEVRYGETSN